MDRITHLYRSKMRPFRDRPDIEVWGRWYWSPPGAKVVPYWHVFGSILNKMDGGEVNPLVGEQEGYTTPSPAITDPRYTGQHVCGTAEEWEFGVYYADRNRHPVDSQGIPLCCAPRALLPGGLLMGGGTLPIGPDGGAEDLLGAGVDEEPAVLGAGDVLGAGVNEEPAVLGAGDVLGAGVNEVNELDGAEDVLGAGTDEEPATEGADDVLAGGVTGEPVFPLVRVGVRLESWTGRNAAPTAILTVGVRLTSWLGRSEIPTAIVTVGERLNVWTGTSEEPTAIVTVGERLERV